MHRGAGSGWKVIWWCSIVSVARDATTAPAICSQMARIIGGGLWVRRGDLVKAPFFVNGSAKLEDDLCCQG